MLERCLLFLISLTILSGAMITDQSIKAQEQYREPYRPQFHFSPAENWTNDPNGLVYYEGEYHLFYQYHPESTVWGPMHWGHAVSIDLVHWEHLPIALYPDAIGPIWSGGAVVDAENTSGLVPGGGLVAIFSYQDQSQGIAYSTDRGRTWTYYAGNPVMPSPGSDFRDPKVFWHAATGQWVMIISKGARVQIYNSPNLIDWTLASEFSGQGSLHGPWEVPDLFPLTFEGETHWVMLVSAGGAPAGGQGVQYFIGDFDGQTFTNANPHVTTLWLDYGPDNYAGTTWENAPDDRRIYIGWMNHWSYAAVIPTSIWRGAMTLPREFALVNTAEGLRLEQKPVPELMVLRQAGQTWFDQTITPGSNLLAGQTGRTLEIIAEFELGTAQSFGLRVFQGADEATTILYNVERESLIVNRLDSGVTDFSGDFPGAYLAPMPPQAGRVKMHVFVDWSSVEVFGNDGAVALSAQAFPQADSNQLELFAIDGDVKLVQLEIFPLDSIWP
jgi:fructan beta-fructosidase